MSTVRCDHCNKPATVHMQEIRGGKRIETHLCEQCAAQAEGVPAKGNTPINELLTNFVMQHSGMQKDVSVACEHCGITWAEFREQHLLGCQHDYDVFAKELTPLLQRAHEGATHHVGKAPAHADGAAAAGKRRKSTDATRLRKELQRAVEAEDYERAAKIRDQIRQAEMG